jgi:hypothetical protein
LSSDQTEPFSDWLDRAMSTFTIDEGSDAAR